MTHAPLIIKKYSNRRLYNTQSSAYITLEDLKHYVKQGTQFTVQDAKDGTDLTRITLAQIIYEEEIKPSNILPESFLRYIICLYDDQQRSLFTFYLEFMLPWYEQNRNLIEQYFKQQQPLDFKNLQTSPHIWWQHMASQQKEMVERFMHFFEGSGKK